MVAVWLTATIAAGATYLVISVSESGEAGYHKYDYTRSRCTHLPSSRSLVVLHGFTPLLSGQTAVATRREGVGMPTLIWVRNGDHRCVARWALDDGP